LRAVGIALPEEDSIAGSLGKEQSTISTTRLWDQRMTRIFKQGRFFAAVKPGGGVYCSVDASSISGLFRVSRRQKRYHNAPERIPAKREGRMCWERALKLDADELNSCK